MCIGLHPLTAMMGTLRFEERGSLESFLSLPLLRTSLLIQNVNPFLSLSLGFSNEQLTRMIGKEEREEREKERGMMREEREKERGMMREENRWKREINRAVDSVFACHGIVM